MSNDGARVAWGLSEAGSEESTLRVRDVATGADLPDAHPPHASRDRRLAPRRQRRSSTRATPRRATSRQATRSTSAASTATRSAKTGRVTRSSSARAATSSTSRRCSSRRTGAGSSCACTWAGRRARSGCATWRRRERPGVAVATRPRGPLRAAPARRRALRHDQRGRAALPPLRGRLRRSRADARGGRCSPSETTSRRTWPSSAAPTACSWRSYLHEASARIERFARGRSAARPGRAAGARLRDDRGRVGRGRGVRRAHVVRDAVAGAALRSGATGATTTWDRVGASFALPDVRVSMLYATSKDGTRVPMFVVEKAGTVRDGDRPAVLYGYGGFNIAQTPAFSARTLLTVEHGGVWAVALLRGGGRVRRGLAPRRDARAKAERLRRSLRVRRGAVPGRGDAPRAARRRRRFERGPARRRGRHAASGALPRRPEPRAARRHAPLPPLPHRAPLDRRVRRPGRRRPPSRWLHAYSPYHQAKDGLRYPSVLFTTAESDSRVDPMHARKMAARLQEAAGRHRAARSCCGSRAGRATGPESRWRSWSTSWSTSSPSCSTSSG